VSQENKEQELSTESTENASTEAVATETGERDARRGSRERAPRGERRDREDTKSPFLERVVTIAYQDLVEPSLTQCRVKQQPVWFCFVQQQLVPVLSLVVQFVLYWNVLELTMF